MLTTNIEVQSMFKFTKLGNNLIEQPGLPNAIRPG
jgi:hypothetical protein